MRAAWWHRGANNERGYLLTVQAVAAARRANRRVVSAMRAIREAEELELARCRPGYPEQLAAKIALLQRQAG